MLQKEKKIFDQEKAIIIKDLKNKKERIKFLEQKLKESEDKRDLMEQDMSIEEKQMK